jgi:hypothetical protein
MNQKTMISITLMAAFAIAIVSAGMTRAEAYTSDDLSTSASQAYHIVKNLHISTFAIQTCTDQMTSGDLSHVDACISMMKIIDNHMSQAVSEANSNIQEITGYGQQGLVGSSGLVN